MTHPANQTYPVQAWQDLWHEAADAIEQVAVDEDDEFAMINLARFIRVQAGPPTDSVWSITIHFQDEQSADVARRYVRRAVDARDRNE